jgi:hypothetical protein
MYAGLYIIVANIAQTRYHYIGGLFFLMQGIMVNKLTKGIAFGLGLISMGEAVTASSINTEVNWNIEVGKEYKVDLKSVDSFVESLKPSTLFGRFLFGREIANKIRETKKSMDGYELVFKEKLIFDINNQKGVSVRECGIAHNPTPYWNEPFDPNKPMGSSIMFCPSLPNDANVFVIDDFDFENLKRLGFTSAKLKAVNLKCSHGRHGRRGDAVEDVGFVITELEKPTTVGKK